MRSRGDIQSILNRIVACTSAAASARTLGAAQVNADQACEALRRVANGEPRGEIALSYAFDYSAISRLKARHGAEL